MTTPMRILLATALLAAAPLWAESRPDALGLAGARVANFLELFSDVKCTEQVTQEKLKADGRLEFKSDSVYDYLIIMSNAGGELTLDESRLALKETKQDKRPGRSLLVSNGFATLFLVLHPYYSPSFQFTDLGPDPAAGHNFRRFSFRHIPGTRSPAALALRGREYPLEVSGYVWIDAETGDLGRIVATAEEGLQDIGMKSMQSEVQFAPVPFRNLKQTYWFPSVATVEVETPRQHWRNTHHFTDYKQFSVSTEEKIAGQ